MNLDLTKLQLFKSSRKEAFGICRNSPVLLPSINISLNLNLDLNLNLLKPQLFDTSRKKKPLLFAANLCSPAKYKSQIGFCIPSLPPSQMPRTWHCIFVSCILFTLYYCIWFAIIIWLILYSSCLRQNFIQNINIICELGVC